jgi:hypothetical protein
MGLEVLGVEVRFELLAAYALARDGGNSEEAP